MTTQQPPTQGTPPPPAQQGSEPLQTDFIESKVQFSDGHKTPYTDSVRYDQSQVLPNNLPRSEEPRTFIIKGHASQQIGLKFFKFIEIRTKEPHWMVGTWYITNVTKITEVWRTNSMTGYYLYVPSFLDDKHGLYQMRHSSISDIGGTPPVSGGGHAIPPRPDGSRPPPVVPPPVVPPPVVPPPPSGTPATPKLPIPPAGTIIPYLLLGNNYQTIYWSTDNRGVKILKVTSDKYVGPFLATEVPNGFLINQNQNIPYSGLHNKPPGEQTTIFGQKTAEQLKEEADYAAKNKDKAIIDIPIEVFKQVKPTMITTKNGVYYVPAVTSDSANSEQYAKAKESARVLHLSQKNSHPYISEEMRMFMLTNPRPRYANTHSSFTDATIARDRYHAMIKG